jgi:hypothetical protein
MERFQFNTIAVRAATVPVVGYAKEDREMGETWVICPDCACKPGEDHKDGCPREKRRHALFPGYDPSKVYIHPDPRMALSYKDMPSYPPTRWTTEGKIVLPLVESKY